MRVAEGLLEVVVMVVSVGGAMRVLMEGPM